MLNSKTVFILGAGASHEVGFPLGSELKNIISSKLYFKFNGGSKPSGSGDKRIYAILKSQYNSNVNDYLTACRQIRDGIILSDSIDDFIDMHQHDQRIALCGKLAIACSILEAEKESKLYFARNNNNNTIDFNTLNDVWYNKFYRLINKQVLKQNLDNIFDNITVINFNYDRSLEHFLTHAISRNYIIGVEDAKQIVKKLVIYRPYGSIDQSVEFGSDDLPEYNDIISKLKTYTEQVENPQRLKEVQQIIQEAGVLVFLGMAYHPNNMNLLKVNCEKMPKIYATRLGISDDDIPVLRRRIMNMLNPSMHKDNPRRLYDEIASKVIFFDDKCTNLFDKYRLTLSEH